MDSPPDKTYPITNCAAIILAAGKSSRLGKPKQLLNYRGKTLLQHAIDTAIEASLQDIIVVLGFGFELIKDEINIIAGTHVVRNEDWQSGMASSIICGINTLNSINSLADAAIFMVCDQPFISTSLLNELIVARKTSGKLIAASKYGDTVGIPALFHKSLFHHLLELKGDVGAKKVIQQNPDAIITVPFSNGGIDIDTLDDYLALAK